MSMNGKDKDLIINIIKLLMKTNGSQHQPLSGFCNILNAITIFLDENYVKELSIKNCFWPMVGFLTQSHLVDLLRDQFFCSISIWETDLCELVEEELERIDPRHKVVYSNYDLLQVFLYCFKYPNLSKKWEEYADRYGCAKEWPFVPYGATNFTEFDWATIVSEVL